MPIYFYINSNACLYSVLFDGLQVTGISRRGLTAIISQDRDLTVADQRYAFYSETKTSTISSPLYKIIRPKPVSFLSWVKKIVCN